MTRSWKPRAYETIRNYGDRDADRSRNIQRPAVPTGVKRQTAIQRSMFPRPSSPLPIREAKRHARYFKVLDKKQTGTRQERERRTSLTLRQHGSHTGKIGSEGFRKYSTVKGIPYMRDRSPHNSYEGKERQYAYQNEFIQSQKHRDTASGDQVSPFRWKRDDAHDRGTNVHTNLTAFRFYKRQPVRSQVT